MKIPSVPLSQRGGKKETRMPHFGLMDEQSLGPVEGPAQRARLHLRGARRRLRQGKISAGIVTLYDAVEAAMHAYVHARDDAKNPVSGVDERSSERDTYRALVLTKVLDGSFDFESFDRLTEQALHKEMPAYDYGAVLAGVESVMLQLGILPFDESSLPPEDPNTF
jgi:hypothetical protein